MEYFNFEDAAHALPPFDMDDMSSLAPEMTQDEANECFDSLFFDKTHMMPSHSIAHDAPVKLKLMNDIEIEVIRQPDDPNLQYPMFRAKTPCELCSRMGMDCFLASRGTMITGCTCCISLFKDCSFTHPKIPKGYIQMFSGIGEDEACDDFTSSKRRMNKSFDAGAERLRKSGSRFPRDAVKILKQWLGEHADHPYPNERQKDELKELTGLKKSQISNWLANARRRGKVRSVSGDASPMLGAIDIPQQANPEWSELGPLDRWKASPPENEPASMTAIARAMTGTPLSGRRSTATSRPNSKPNSKPNSRKASSEDSSGFSMFRAPSDSSDLTRESSNSDFTFASSRSARSKQSISSSQADRRRRRRAPMTQRTAAQQAKTRSARIFQCTFCTDTFPAKYDWQRHEKSLHLALERWTCCPDHTGTYTVPMTGCQHCNFCNEQDPIPAHLESHNFHTCQEKTMQERTFYRKDHLRQHLKLMHSAKFEPHMESWKTTTNEIKSSCGFCPSKFATWSQRADHLAAHFRNGADMSHWAGNWGFEPYIDRLVENSIPPYLIGQERSSMQPYVARFKKASDNVSRKISNTPTSNTPSASTLTYGTSAPDSCDEIEPETGELDQMTKDTNCWGRLEQELSKFVTQFRLQGTIPSDRQLQDQARLVIYEDDDPWNWTCADNQQWLDTFKYSQGIGNVTNSMQTDQLAEVPVLAPYVIKGGNRMKASRQQTQPNASPARQSSFANSTTTPVRGGFGSRQNSRQKSMPGSATPVPDFNPEMELDFDSIDFAGLDLGMMEGDEFGDGLDGGAVMYGGGVGGVGGDVGMGGMLSTTGKMSAMQPIHQQQYVEGVVMGGAGGMSEDDVRALAGYGVLN